MNNRVSFKTYTTLETAIAVIKGQAPWDLYGDDPSVEPIFEGENSTDPTDFKMSKPISIRGSGILFESGTYYGCVTAYGTEHLGSNGKADPKHPQGIELFFDFNLGEKQDPKPLERRLTKKLKLTKTEPPTGFIR